MMTVGTVALLGTSLTIGIARTWFGAVYVKETRRTFYIIKLIFNYCLSKSQS